MVVVTLVIGGEILARHCLGLGTPPLYIRHPTIEYMFKPNQDVHRFGNHIIINQYGMRSEPFERHKADDEFRIMVFGDSVINGGNQTDHTALATTILQERLRVRERAKGKVIVGNISAGSWGPGNWLAYAKEWGFFDADIIVLVLSSHDYADNPDFKPLDENTHPTKPPASALAEGITRYLPRYLPRFETEKETKGSDNSPAKREVIKALDDLREFLRLAKKNTSDVLIFQHWEKRELTEGTLGQGGLYIRGACESMGISPISLEPYFRRSMENGNDPYRDNIHPNPIGQKLIADAILENMPLDGISSGRR